MSRLTEALAQIDFVRRYNLERIESVPMSEWFTIPPGGVSNVAWQMGHIAASQYRLCLERLRPRTPEDESLLPDDFLKFLGRDSQPADAARYTAEELRAAFDRIHARIMTELQDYPDADLDLPALRPHPLFTTRIESLRYAPFHEALHCGQISMIRRMLGQKPIW